MPIQFSVLSLLRHGTIALMVPSAAMAHTDLSRFEDNIFTSAPEVVSCTLEDGTEASCYKITVNYLPEGLDIGPFCPITIDDEGGLWDWDGANAKLYRIDKDFLTMLDELGYRFFDEDGNVYIVDNANTRPEADHACINVTADPNVTVTMLLPIDPKMAEDPEEIGTVGKVGIALDGVPVFADAPSVLDTGHMPALDLCGGHIDPGGWYHWHATATDVETVFETEGVDAHCHLEQDKTAQFGYAFDGYPMFGSAEEDGSKPEDLDTCNGHVGETSLGITYHYHASEDFPNLPPCLVGVQAQDNFTTTASVGIGAPRGEDMGHAAGHEGTIGAGHMNTPPGFDEAAGKLGVTATELLQALISSGQDRPDLAVAAETLGVSEDALTEALPQPPRQ